MPALLGSSHFCDYTIRLSFNPETIGFRDSKGITNFLVWVLRVFAAGGVR
jgi:hypothetical protein